MENYTVEHQPDESRFIIKLQNNELAELTYEQPKEAVLDLQHTFVPGNYRGKGLGSKLVHYAIEYAQKYKYSIIPTCPAVRDFLQHHPE